MQESNPPFTNLRFYSDQSHKRGTGRLLPPPLSRARPAGRSSADLLVLNSILDLRRAYGTSPQRTRISYAGGVLRASAASQRPAGQPRKASESESEAPQSSCQAWAMRQGPLRISPRWPGGPLCFRHRRPTLSRLSLSPRTSDMDAVPFRTASPVTGTLQRHPSWANRCAQSRGGYPQPGRRRTGFARRS